MKNAVQLRAGDNIYVDRGVNGLDSGELVSIDGASIGGFWGIYKSNEYGGEERLFDQTVHRISKKEES